MAEIINNSFKNNGKEVTSAAIDVSSTSEMTIQADVTARPGQRIKLTVLQSITGAGYDIMRDENDKPIVYELPAKFGGAATRVISLTSIRASNLKVNVVSQEAHGSVIVNTL